MKTWITSDLHFGHNAIARFCPKTRGQWGITVIKDDRPLIVTDLEPMHQFMITDWNSKVSPNDLVYILGDVAFMPAHKASAILHKLNGIKILVAGNHDEHNLAAPVFRDCFKEIHQYLEIQYAGHQISLFHYPIAEFRNQHHGALHFHGHLHGSPSGLEHYRVRDVAFDATGKVVSLLDDMIADALKGEIKKHH